ncbi:MAG: hypothetical protein AB7Q17_06310 [Phycisphaerae bacterium]
MLLADGGFIVWIGGLFILGLIGFTVMAVALVFRFVAFVLRALFGAGASLGGCGDRRSCDPTWKICARAGCGHANPRPARYCGRCGSRFRAEDVDAYG